MTEPAAPATEPIDLAPGRDCGSCTMCCKIMGISEIDKVRNKWCPHCAIGKGCKIYETRPPSCRLFYCQYLRDARIPEHWKPSRSRMVLSYAGNAGRLSIFVDSDRSDAWRKEPYYSDLKTWAKNGVATKTYIVVFIGDDLTVVLPDRDKPIGRVKENQHLRAVTRNGPRGPEFDVELVDADDPLLNIPQLFL